MLTLAKLTNEILELKKSTCELEGRHPSGCTEDNLKVFDLDFIEETKHLSLEGSGLIETRLNETSLKIQADNPITIFGSSPGKVLNLTHYDWFDVVKAGNDQVIAEIRPGSKLLITCHHVKCNLNITKGFPKEEEMIQEDQTIMVFPEYGKKIIIVLRLNLLLPPNSAHHIF